MIHSLNKMLLAARVVSRASKNSWSFEAFTCFHFTAEHGFSYRSTTICHCAKYGQNQRLFRSQNSKSSQTRLLLLFFCKSYPLKGTSTNSTECYCFTWKKNRLLQEPIIWWAPGSLQSFVVTSQKSPAKEKCGHSSRYSPSPPSLFPYIRTSGACALSLACGRGRWLIYQLN